MGQAVVHFEVMGKDGDKLRSFYSDLFDWKIDADNQMNYGMVSREDNLDQGIGIGGGIGAMPEGGQGPDIGEGHVTFYVSVDDVEAAMQKAESLGGSRVMGPMQVPEGPEIGLFKDPEGHAIGVVKTQSM
jgi:predicted enzyme related to lactoylglutathione lyase